MNAYRRTGGAPLYLWADNPYRGTSDRFLRFALELTMREDEEAATPESACGVAIIPPCTAPWTIR
jgi:hypothetical protein